MIHATFSEGTRRISPRRDASSIAEARRSTGSRSQSRYWLRVKDKLPDSVSMIRKNSFLVLRVFQPREGEGPDFVFQILGRIDPFQCALLQKFHIMVQNSPVDLFLRSEVEIHRSLCDSRLFCNRIHDPAHESFAREYRSRRIENLRTAKFGHDLLFGFHQAPGLALPPQARQFQFKRALGLTV